MINRTKSAFTLAEILIVLMVIGALATMTIPSLMKGVTDAQYKTAYKKAYNAIVNLTTMEKIAGNLPSSADSTGVKMMFQSLVTSLSVKDFGNGVGEGATGPTIGSVGDKTESESNYTTSDFKSSIKYKTSNGGDATVGVDLTDTTATAEITLSGTETTTPWIVTEDNLAYLVTVGESATCSSKATINAQTSDAKAVSKSCVVIVVDVNGLSNGPNRPDTQLDQLTSATVALDSLEGDRYYIFIGSDGATAGSKKNTVTGRIAADLK